MSSFPRMGSMDRIRNMATRELRSAVMMRNWEVVVCRFQSFPFPEIQAVKMNQWGDTALHAAIIFGASEDIVAQLIDAIKMSEEEDAIETLLAQNESGNTPLHCAASRGSCFLCHRILSIGPSLVGARNKDGETRLFLSAMYDHREAFFYLLSAGGESILTQCRRLKDGDTVLHCTIKRKYFDLPLEIIRRASDIASFVNDEGESALDVLASIPLAFRTGTHLSWWDSLCYPFVLMGGLESVCLGDHSIVDVQRSETPRIHTHDPLFRFAGIIEKKKRHIRGWQIMQHLLKDGTLDDNLMEWSILRIDGPPVPRPSIFAESKLDEQGESRWTPLLRATKCGAIEAVRAILKAKPNAIYDETNYKKDIVLVAVEERQSIVLKDLMKQPFWKEEWRHNATDIHGNTALHLVAKLSRNRNIPMLAIYMQWEVHWFEYVKSLMPPGFNDRRNDEGRTPGMIFAEEHRELMDQSNKWVKDMSGNYIVASTLISSVTFATCYQIPGGYDGQGGAPIVGSRPEFHIFAITALVSFCSSVTSLAAFLAIYSSQNDRPRHYRRSLPLKLCLGLFSLFVSVVSMLISFCAAHTFELHPSKRSKYTPLYIALTFVPICFYAATQIPLYWDLLKASLSTVPVSMPFYVEQLEEEVEKKDMRRKEKKQEGEEIKERKKEEKMKKMR